MDDLVKKARDHADVIDRDAFDIAPEYTAALLTSLADEVDKLDERETELLAQCAGLEWQIAAMTDEVVRLREALREWGECAMYDALMEGPKFKGWDRSALDRCRRKHEAALAGEQGDDHE